MDWPFEDEADRNDPLTKLRIPVVGTFNPGWRFVAAYIKPVDEDVPDYMKRPPFGSNERPTEREAQMIASFIWEYKGHWFNTTYQEKLLRRPLDVDSGCKTIVFIKYAEDDWGYRNNDWQYGHTFVPPPPSYREKRPEEKYCGGPLTLEQVMDLVHTLSDKPMQHWLDWKTLHPEVFGPGTEGS